MTSNIIITGETEHFHYRVRKGGVYLDAQREHIAFGYTDDEVFLSLDCGKTWEFNAQFVDAAKITFSVILGNGNILFATYNELFLSTDNLKTIEKIVVKNMDGSDYLPHTPVNPDLPGLYFHSISERFCWNVKGKEMLVWGNYANVLGGPVPVNIYYSTDNGNTVKIAYSFGQSPFYQEKNTAAENRPDVILGNPENPVFCRHIHSVAYHPEENVFYASTGDHDHSHECHWLRGKYNILTDAWDWQVIVSDSMHSRYKSGGINIINNKLYWAADCGPDPQDDYGVFSCNPKDLAIPKRHTQLFNPEKMVCCMVAQDNVFLASYCAPVSSLDTGIIISVDSGKTWYHHDLKECGVRSPVRFCEQNSDGWFRVDLREEWVDFTDEVLFIKPKK